MTAAEPEGRPGYLDVLRDCPQYRILFTARTISLLGDWFSMIAILALLRQLLGSSPGAISGVFILKLLPYFLAGPLAGVVADRFSRKWIMFVSDIVRIGLVLGLIAAPSLPSPLIWAYVLIGLQVVASAFFEPARSAALPQLVPDRYLSAANALGAVVWSAMFALGSALGGVVTDLLGWKTALGIDSATYVVSALLILKLRIPPRPARVRGPADWQTMTGLRDLWDGLRFVSRRPDIGTVLFAKSGWGIAGGITLLLTLFGERDYALAGRPDLGVALLFTARAVGTGIGPVLARRLVRSEDPPAMRRLMAGAFVWASLGYVAFSFATHWLVATTLVVLAHFGGSVLWVYSSVLLQRMSPDAFRGRVMATDLGLATLATSLSLWAYGWLAESWDIDLRLLALALGLSLLLPALAWWLAAGRWPVGRKAARDEGDPAQSPVG